MKTETVITTCDVCQEPIEGEYDIVSSTLDQPANKHLEWDICQKCSPNLAAELVRVLRSPGQQRLHYPHLFGRPTTEPLGG